MDQKFTSNWVYGQIMNQKFTSNWVYGPIIDQKLTSNGVYGQTMDQKFTSNGVYGPIIDQNSHRMWNMDRTRTGTWMEHGWNTDGTRIGTRNADGTRIEHGLEKGPVFIDQKGSHENQPKEPHNIIPVLAHQRHPLPGDLGVYPHWCGKTCEALVSEPGKIGFS